MDNLACRWARPLAKWQALLTQNTDYAFSDLFYQLLQFPLFSRYLDEKALRGVDKGRAARNLATFSTLLAKFEFVGNDPKPDCPALRMPAAIVVRPEPDRFCHDWKARCRNAGHAGDVRGRTDLADQVHSVFRFVDHSELPML
jgi:hypothetical protein